MPVLNMQVGLEYKGFFRKSCYRIRSIGISTLNLVQVRINCNCIVDNVVKTMWWIFLISSFSKDFLISHVSGWASSTWLKSFLETQGSSLCTNIRLHEWHQYIEASLFYQNLLYVLTKNCGRSIQYFIVFLKKTLSPDKYIFSVTIGVFFCQSIANSF